MDELLVRPVLPPGLRRCMALATLHRKVTSQTPGMQAGQQKSRAQATEQLGKSSGGPATKTSIRISEAH